MLKFDPEQLTFEIVQLKAVTTAVGGSISVLDTALSTSKKEVFKRIVVPMSVARAFWISTKKISRYLKPCYTCVVRYNDHVVALERHPLGSMGALTDTFNGITRTWTPKVQRNYKSMVLPMITRSSKQWFFDGRYVFSFDGFGATQLEIATRGQPLTKDHKFRKVIAQAVDLQMLQIEDKLVPSERSCLAFISSRGAAAISPPIWKNLSEVGVTQLKRAGSAADGDEDDEEEVSREDKTSMVPDFNFDAVNETLKVNLNFALRAGVEIGKTFGYEEVEPLQLPRMMIQLHTVNLPNVAKEVKATYDIEMPFLTALSWLLGLSRRADTLETYIMMRSLMKYLTRVPSG
jgi:hypothetical protein